MNAESKVNRVVGNSWFAAILAVLELILGFLMLSFPFILGAAAIWVAGFALIVIGLVHIWNCVSRRGHRIWNLISGCLYIVAGSVMVLLPFASLSFITLIIGLALLVGGILRLIVAISMCRQIGSAWRFFNAIVSLILGAMVVWSWPASSLWLVGTIIAIEMIFSGWSLLFISLTPKEK